MNLTNYLYYDICYNNNFYQAQYMVILNYRESITNCFTEPYTKHSLRYP